MTTSPHRSSNSHGSEPEFDLLAHEAPTSPYLPPTGDVLFDQEQVDDGSTWASTDGGAADPHHAPGYGPVVGGLDLEAAHSANRSRGGYRDDDVPATEYSSMPGMPGRGVILLTAFLAGGCAALDFALTGSLTIFFDLCFVVICLVATMAVRRHDVFTTGVLPPLVFAAVIAGVAVIAPTTFVATGALSEVFLTGLTQHAGALVAGYGVALLTVAGRIIAHRNR
jgi:hypothetical protein